MPERQIEQVERADIRMRTASETVFDKEEKQDCREKERAAGPAGCARR